ncbi:MAG TPA: DUF1454 family protein [Buttiauxella sp.]|uniref:DUF1454 family protein n=1 Tax=Buttiauxella sp. TaxID=1972222 RepID=UPI002B46B408|nr:DUF1454 family protein [Buttiauxella sp.]HKM98428.1 DUF1454 family protein [Buttiauxella sp.]
MRHLVAALALLILPVAVVWADPPSDSTSTPQVAPYLLAGAPTFDMNITQFRETFSAKNPTLPINEFRAIDPKANEVNLMRAASKINENLYTSTALERGTLKIKSIQITWLPIQGPEQKAARAKATEYMAALIRTFTPLLSKQQSVAKLTKLLSNGKNKRYYAQTEGAIRYVVADNGEKGLTFAVEPIKLTLSETINTN